MSARDLPLVIKIHGHPDIHISVPAQDSVDVSIASPTGTDLAMLTLSNIESPTAILGHWPDGEEWVDEGDVPLASPRPRHTGRRNCEPCADEQHAGESDMPGRCECCGLDTDPGPETT